MNKGLRIAVDYGDSAFICPSQERKLWPGFLKSVHMIPNVVFVSLQDLLESVNPIVEYRPM